MEKELPEFKDDLYVKLPINCLLDNRLDPFDKVLFGYMAFRYQYFVEKLGKTYFESTQTFADVFGVHRNTISRALSTLEKTGYLVVSRKKGYSNIYTINIAIKENGKTSDRSENVAQSVVKVESKSLNLDNDFDDDFF